MNRKTMLVVVSIVLLALIGGGIFALSRNAGKQDDADDMHGNTQNASNKESPMYKEFAALKGEEYERMFLASMVAHHQGAVDMANLALAQAGHSELKTMAQDIISAQNKEIGDMQSWQKNWGYPASSGDHMMDHSAMGMENDMAMMTNELKDLSGNAFDKKFIELMIGHHQSAIDMARPAARNAQHTEVKTLAQNIIAAQTKEISQMKTWQKDWKF